MPILVRAVTSIFTILKWLIILECILSFIPSDSLYEIRELVGRITAPLLMPFRRIQEKIIPGLMIDFSPIIAWALLSLIQTVIISFLL
ncbi:YggT family protein [Clostridium acetobutylicum]|uniref:Predicted integral membrane protein, YggT family n=1 Tax=Clostridium acetobutylicum (strain ATCC 824 / DSM 792 / JCM 1419 / IAM 19013 / LMG 5710 / NBRC 13948 / NRRL B-527 / VKM B-1787 / 2291 / W) TaxID=272562 RepID=Q97H94_CLOAB|nr:MULTISPECIES: YggT family protein [Clostridium]AAK80077.1 Predicted integral membrane protein, YggT family [Clostridium acetobutylicum ATCC 824]ADZ21170.1 integral membrane protein, YggT family [Clostridium acetobutylicum EA 2018]AEI32191.1 YggT family integral membrane protein [Clostridium acetobutylicum DSM 1731]AWV79496.1 YggT family protein [Clostridium acetobutylicum]KHD38263.1 hypothetical protein NL50_01805 [Clostridium acetobutylicum]